MKQAEVGENTIVLINGTKFFERLTPRVYTLLRSCQFDHFNGGISRINFKSRLRHQSREVTRPAAKIQKQATCSNLLKESCQIDGMGIVACQLSILTRFGVINV